MNRFLIFCLTGLTTSVLLCACGGGDESATESSAAAPTSPAPYTTRATASITPGLHATIQGKLQTEVHGKGTYRFIRARQQRSGYHYLGDGDDSNDLTLALVFPAKAYSGVFQISSTTPADTGKVYEARLETKDYGSFSYNTDGILTLNQIQTDQSGHLLASGTFEFISENESGEKVHVKGDFNFNVNDASSDAS